MKNRNLNQEKNSQHSPGSDERNPFSPQGHLLTCNLRVHEVQHLNISQIKKQQQQQK